MSDFKVCVSGLPVGCDENTLVTHFSNFGIVSFVDLQKDVMSGESRGYGFVGFNSEAGVAGALSKTVQHSIGGQFVTVTKVDDQRGGGPGDMAAGWQAPPAAPAAGAIMPFVGTATAPPAPHPNPLAAHSSPGEMNNFAMGGFPGGEMSGYSAGSMEVFAGSAGSPESAQEARVFVGGLPHGTVEETLRTFFSQFGTVASCDMKYDLMTGLPRGFAFINFESPAVAQHVMSVGQHDLGNGQMIECKPASEKGKGKGKDKDKGGGGYGGAWDPWGGKGGGWDMGYGGGYGGGWDPKGGMMGKGGDKGWGKEKGKVHEQNPCKIFIGGCPKTITEEEVRSYFSQFGTISTIEMKYDQFSGIFRGFCFVIYEDEKMAQNALAGFENHQLQGQWVEVKLAGGPPRGHEEPKGGKGKDGKDPDTEALKVFVGGLAKATPEEDIRAYFENFGPVANVLLKKDEEGNSRGFAFISYVEENAVHAVLSNYENNRIGDKWVEVKLASSQDKGKGKGKDSGKGYGKDFGKGYDYGMDYGMMGYDKGYGKGYDKGWGKDPWGASSWAPPSKGKDPWGKGAPAAYGYDKGYDKGFGKKGGYDDWSKGYGKGSAAWGPSPALGGGGGFGKSAGKGGWGYSPY